MQEALAVRVASPVVVREPVERLASVGDLERALRAANDAETLRAVRTKRGASRDGQRGPQPGAGAGASEAARTGLRMPSARTKVVAIPSGRCGSSA